METTENVSTNGDRSISGDVDWSEIFKPKKPFLADYLDDPFPLTSYQEKLIEHIRQGCVTKQKWPKFYISMAYHHGKSEMRRLLQQKTPYEEVDDLIRMSCLEGESNAQMHNERSIDGVYCSRELPNGGSSRSCFEQERIGYLRGELYQA